jgi:low affinity Fe/Cu permease
MNRLFQRFTGWIASVVGSPYGFGVALVLVLVWSAAPLVGFSPNWQLLNTGTAIVTFLLVFLIQHTQNRDSKAVHIKLDEIIRAIGPARKAMINVDQLSDEGLQDVENELRTEDDDPLKRSETP